MLTEVETPTLNLGTVLQEQSRQEVQGKHFCSLPSFHGTSLAGSSTLLLLLLLFLLYWS